MKALTDEEIRDLIRLLASAREALRVAAEEHARCHERIADLQQRIERLERDVAKVG